MPRRSKGPRLWYRPPKGREAGGWLILDGKRQCRTGVAEADVAEAERRLSDYIDAKHGMPRRQRRLAEIEIADVLNLYAQDCLPRQRNIRSAVGRLARLGEWWGRMRLDEVTGAACRQYAATRPPGSARRELQDFRAAINHHHKEGLHREVVRVVMPPAGPPRERWLTPQEVARLVRVCLHTAAFSGSGGERRPLRHIARFVLFCVYTGSRPGDVMRASFYASSDRGYIDLDRGLYFRKPPSKVATKKRQPTIPLPPRLLAHLRRWHRLGAKHVVEYNGRPIERIDTAFSRAVELAQLGDEVMPYSLRHSAGTWMLQRGVPIWEVAGYLGTSEEMVRRHYGHQAPDHLKQAVAGIVRGR